MKCGPGAVGLVTCLLAAAVAGQDGLPANSLGRTAWSWLGGTGIDSYVHSFPLATTDTTVTVSEYYALLRLEGRSGYGGAHRWRLRPELSAGSELIRGRLDFSYQYQPRNNRPRLSLEAIGLSRHYRPRSVYSLSSDAVEGWIRARAALSPAGATQFELRADAGGVLFREPSTLEVNYGDLGGGFAWRSGGDATRRFALGARLVQRTYPDSSAIDRTVVALEGEYDAVELGGRGVRVFHRSDRRQVRDETARPSAWTHWSRLEWVLPAGGLDLKGELASEVWDYESVGSVYYDSWRWSGLLAIQGGRLVLPTWWVGLAAERFDARQQPETYTQAGVRIGLETYGSAGHASLTAEYGRRDYSASLTSAEIYLDVTPGVSTMTGDPTSLSSLGYSDFYYWELWLLATWALSSHFALDGMANYQPENHTEKSDDASVAFITLRLVFQP